MRTCQHQHPASAGCPRRCQLVHNRRFTATADQADSMFFPSFTKSKGQCAISFTSPKITYIITHSLKKAVAYLRQPLITLVFICLEQQQR